MTTSRLLELVAALAIFAAGIWFYRRKPAHDDPGASDYGNQGAVILLVVAAIIAIHALGMLDYHPSDSELKVMKGEAS